MCIKRGRGDRRYLRQGRLVHAVDVRPRLGFDLVHQRLVADGAVDQRLHTKREKRHKSRQALQNCSSGRRARKTREGGRETNPVVPQLATRRVGRPSGTSGGFEVEVVVDVGHVEAVLEVQKKSVNNNNNNKADNLT